MEEMAPKYHYSSEHFTKLYVTVAATRIKPDDPYRKVTEEGVSSLSLYHPHFRGAETGGKYKQGGPCAGRVLLVSDPCTLEGRCQQSNTTRGMLLLFHLHNGY
jgi:hypothetical protein